MSARSRPRIGVSACLLGRPVRFDGGHKKNDFVADTLSRFVDLVPVCPEVESGMSVPRETLRLVSNPAGLRLMANRSGTDQTDRMTSYAECRVSELEALDLDGFVFKKDSPSCGLERVRVYGEGPNTQPSRTGTGLFAAMLGVRLPVLPLTEEGWLHDPALRESFLARIFTHHRMRTCLLDSPSRGKLIAFHAEHKLLYMAHSPSLYRELGRIAAQVADQPLPATIQLYATQAMAALRQKSTPGKQANVLQHILGYFKNVLAPTEKQELLLLIDDFRAGLHGLAVPLTLLLHHLRKHDVGEWLGRQRYFQPYPKELGAR
ncbi:MAG: DUF1722 domain-containing protein [Myxococcales bacterium]|nr:DUF1722 domain-containing protein [Myxococcales bacterium]